MLIRLSLNLQLKSVPWFQMVSASHMLGNALRFYSIFALPEDAIAATRIFSHGRGGERPSMMRLILTS